MKDSTRRNIGKGLTLFLGIVCFLGITAAARQELPIFKALIEAGGSIVWEGATRNAFQTTFAVVDPTADHTITFPNSTGTVALNPAAGSIEFEGTTANDFETTLAVTDPTADRTVTIPNASGTVVLSTLATNAPDAANSVTGASNTLLWEGTGVDAHEIALDAANATADVIYRMADAAAGTYGFMSSTLATNAPDIANSVTGGTNSLIFEGSGVDAFEHTIIGTNPTVGDQVWTMPDFAVAVTGAFMFSSLATNGPDIANSVTGGTNSLIFEGATADAYETTVTPTDPTADRTITIPNATGTVVLTPSTVDITASADTTGGNAGAKTEFIGLPRIMNVGIGTMVNGTTQTVLTDIGDSETPATDWTAVDGDTVMSNDSAIYRQGTASLKMAVAATADATDGCTNALASGDQDWTDDEALGMWIYTDKALEAGDLILQIHDVTAAGGFTAVNFSAVTANAWQWIELDVTLGNNNLKDVTTDLSIVLSAAGAVQAAAGAFNVYFDFIVKWDVADEDTLGQAIQQDGVLSLTMIDATDSGATSANLALYTDYFVHYQSGNDAIVAISDQSGADKVGLALIAY